MMFGSSTKINYQLYLLSTKNSFKGVKARLMLRFDMKPDCSRTSVRHAPVLHIEYSPEAHFDAFYMTGTGGHC